VPAALAGGLYPILSRYVSPESAFGLEVALTPVVAVLLGGPGTRWGALLGTLLYLAVQELLWTQSGTWNLALLGLGLMVAAVFKPEGLTNGSRPVA